MFSSLTASSRSKWRNSFVHFQSASQFFSFTDVRHQNNDCIKNYTLKLSGFLTPLEYDRTEMKLAINVGLDKLHQMVCEKFDVQIKLMALNTPHRLRYSIAGSFFIQTNRSVTKCNCESTLTRFPTTLFYNGTRTT